MKVAESSTGFYENERAPRLSEQGTPLASREGRLEDVAPKPDPMDTKDGSRWISRLAERGSGRGDDGIPAALGAGS